MMKNRGGHFKKGLSPIIATVLLIMLVLILASLIYFWMTGFITEQIEKNGQAIENICPSVVFDADIISNGTGNFLEAVNRGSVTIYSFDIKTSKNGGSNIKNALITLGVGNSIIENIDEYVLVDGNLPSEVTIYPVLIGRIKGGKTDKTYTCTNLGKTISF